MALKIGDRVKIKGTKETYELGIQHRLGRVHALRADGELVDVILDLGRVVKLSAEEVVHPTERDLARAGG